VIRYPILVTALIDFKLQKVVIKVQSAVLEKIMRAREWTHLRKQEVERAPFISDPLITFTHYILHVVDRQGELRLREKRGKIRRIKRR